MMNCFFKMYTSSSRYIVIKIERQSLNMRVTVRYMSDICLRFDLLLIDCLHMLTLLKPKIYSKGL